MPMQNTPETMAKAREAARQARIANKALGLRRDFADAKEWEALARARHLRLPVWDVPVTATRIKQWIKKVGWSMDDYYRWMGGPGEIGLFAKLNPTWLMRALAGLMLEVA